MQRSKVLGKTEAQNSGASVSTDRKGLGTVNKLAGKERLVVEGLVSRIAVWVYGW